MGLYIKKIRKLYSINFYINVLFIQFKVPFRKNVSTTIRGIHKISREECVKIINDQNKEFKASCKL